MAEKFASAVRHLNIQIQEAWWASKGINKTASSNHLKSVLKTKGEGRSLKAAGEACHGP